MNKNWMKTLAAGMATLMLAGSLVGCGSNDQGNTDTALKGTISLAGSTSMEKLCEAMSESFMETYPDITVTVEYTGSGAGIESLTAGSILIGVPIALLTAVFLTEIANKTLASIVGSAVELLAAIPSVIYGLLGMMLLNSVMFRLEKLIFAGSTSHQFTGGSNMLSAVIVLAIMILPTVINISASSIRAVTKDLRAASLALGASKIQTIFKVTIPAAKSGNLTGIVLGIGRALGEAMAINMVAGGSVNLPLPFHSVRFLTTQLVSEMGYAEGLHRQVLFTVGLVLYVFIMVINLILMKVRKEAANND